MTAFLMARVSPRRPWPACFLLGTRVALPVSPLLSPLLRGAVGSAGGTGSLSAPAPPPESVHAHRWEPPHPPVFSCRRRLRQTPEGRTLGEVERGDMRGEGPSRPRGACTLLQGCTERQEPFGSPLQDAGRAGRHRGPGRASHPAAESLRGSPRPAPPSRGLCSLGHVAPPLLVKGVSGGFSPTQEVVVFMFSKQMRHRLYFWLEGCPPRRQCWAFPVALVRPTRKLL